MQEKIQETVEAAQKIVVIQADNPDADSLGSALALEHVLGDLRKDVVLYCGVNVPEYLRYLAGWDRVVDTLPSQFDLSIIVDASTYTLLDKLDKSSQLA
jgi:nanoRNase/pAp phosphatase (c-di-AMP/oligoRNAs hydrolase)